MPLDDRERSFENALARHLRPGAARGACSDAEMLAAYHEQSLAAEAMASLKAHIGECERCRQILAELQSSEELPLATDLAHPEIAAAKTGVRVIPARKPRLWGWIAPAGALAAGLLVWVALYENNAGRFAKAPPRGDATPTQIATAQPSSGPPAPPPSLAATTKRERLSADTVSPSDTVQPSPSKTASMPQQRPQSRTKEKDSERARKPSSSASGVAGGFAGMAPRLITPSAPKPVLQPTPPGSLAEAVTVEAVPAGAASNQAPRAALGKIESEPKSANDKRDDAYSRSEASESAQAGAPQPARAPMPAPPQSSQSVQVNAESSTITTPPAHGRQVADLTNLNETAQLLLASGSAAVTISAPDGRTSWRIGSAGVILFSSDAGKTWVVQPSGIGADLLAGSAPSAKVCWIVGRGGTILRTTDNGKHWHKVQPPTEDDFLSVFAVNARQATVSPASGRYQTTDGGTTWNKLIPE